MQLIGNFGHLAGILANRASDRPSHRSAVARGARLVLWIIGFERLFVICPIDLVSALGLGAGSVPIIDALPLASWPAYTAYFLPDVRKLMFDIPEATYRDYGPGMVVCAVVRYALVHCFLPNPRAWMARPGADRGA